MFFHYLLSSDWLPSLKIFLFPIASPLISFSLCSSPFGSIRLPGFVLVFKFSKTLCC
uniref:Uncharacterized protein n=1 Tax=Rhizophora mucronata TaxID=61149 RepID=A0A2P2J5J0_RHIMU